MWRWLIEYARAIRAFLALCAALGLAAMLFVFEQHHNREQAAAINNVADTVWSMSELHFETQRMVSAVAKFADGHTGLDDLRVRFDILWSRVEVADFATDGLGPIFDPVLAQYGALLKTFDPVVFDAAPEPETLYQLSDQLEDLALQSREIWAATFGTQAPAARFGGAESTTLQHRGTEFVALFLITLLMLYVLAEVYFANMGQKKEAALRHEAAEANAAKTRFLANVSHEIRTPLNGILGMASELSESPLNADQAKCLRVIEQSGTVLLGTINDVLDLSRIEAGRLATENHPFVLRDLVEAACALYSARAREKSLALKLHVQENLPPVLMGDEMRIRQILHNLVANAVKFTATGGVTIRVRSDLEGSRLVIAVQDTGPGIEREAQARIFEPFLQADSSVTRQHGGSGLGLSISRQLCQAMGGDLSVVSRPGHGATFFCDLPLQTASAEQVREAHSTPPPVPDLTGTQILVADDNATNRLILSRFLKATGADLLFAQTGEEAIAKVRENGCGIVLMDVQMPVLDGVAATQRLRAFESESGRAPAFIVAVTANVLSHQVQSYVAAGMNEVLSKPVSKRDLMALLGRHFRGMPAAGRRANAEVMPLHRQSS